MTVRQHCQQLLPNLFACCHPVVKESQKTHLSWWPHSSSAPDKDIEAVAPLILQPALHSTFPNRERWHCYSALIFMDTLKLLDSDVLHSYYCRAGGRHSLCVCFCTYTWWYLNCFFCLCTTGRRGTWTLQRCEMLSCSTQAGDPRASNW